MRPVPLNFTVDTIDNYQLKIGFLADGRFLLSADTPAAQWTPGKTNITLFTFKVFPLYKK